MPTLRAAALGLLLLATGLAGATHAPPVPGLAAQLLAGGDPLALAALGLDARAAHGPPLAVAHLRAQLALATGVRDVRDPVEAALAGMRWQTQLLGAAPLRMTDSLSPGRAAVALLDHFDAHADPDQLAELARLDALAPAPRAALARVLDADLAYVRATEGVFAGADVLGMWAGTSQVDLAPILPAREALLRATADLRDALTRDPPGPEAQAHFVVAPVLAIDLLGVADTYTDNLVFILDIAGDDTYHNNAGGSAMFLDIPPSPLACANAKAGGAGALIDLGGNDRYDGGHSCGINGGGAIGSGFLFDAAGDDTYRAGDIGLNGAGTVGLGFLLDASGDDVYDGGSIGSNGGGSVAGLGMLIDGGGNDRYASGSWGGNGGGYSGIGMLLDLGGDDAYSAADWGVNGGGSAAGAGFLFDAGGNDAYAAGEFGTNAGAYLGGAGLLLDLAGDDAYVATAWGTNGGADNGASALLDLGGDDTYTATDDGTNGGGLAGVGMLLDAGGNDSYTATDQDTNGGGGSGGAGLLLDLAGNDRYTAGDFATNGGAIVAGSGMLLDKAGNDTYAAGSFGANGGGFTAGHGLLLDAGGDDTYTAGHDGANGGGATGVGLLLDLGGQDAYRDAFADCRDCSVLPKGLAGAQADLG